MGRVLLVLTAACLVATFMIINNYSFKFGTTSASPKNEEVKPKSEKDRPIKQDREARGRVTGKVSIYKSRRGASTSAPVIDASTPIDDGDEEEVVLDPSHATVKGDTPVYSINSKDSSVVKVLKKGDRVSTDLDVIDGKGRWTIVKKTDLSKPGFVLQDKLQPGKATKKKGTVKKAAAN